ncbi:MAG: helix-turn-helix transcriptional regulator [Prevotellaceae bacterium]|jgi:DNA-binding CsgD family transcriptional regulator|nr:helix-turn-helix transcriptional regulator [Prevotellaceae bacterium]
MGEMKQRLLANVKLPVIEKSEYDKIELFKKTLDMLSGMCNQSIFILDYSTQGFLYLSPHPLFLCGHTVDEAMEMGFDFLEEVIAPESQEMLTEIARSGWQFFYETIEEEGNGALSYDIYLKHKNGLKTLVNQKSAPFFLTKDGNPWLVICLVGHSSRKKAGNMIFARKDKTEYYTYDFQKKKRFPYRPPELTKREKEVSLLILRGYDTETIAKELDISPNTVKNHRANIEVKLSESNLFDTISAFYSLLG